MSANEGRGKVCVEQHFEDTPFCEHCIFVVSLFVSFLHP
jgi:hypothetical protein